MSWRLAFEPWEPYDYTCQVSEFIRSFGLNPVVDYEDDYSWICYIEDENGEEIYDRGNGSDWTEIERHLPDDLLVLLDAVQDWSNPACRLKKKRKTIVGSMAILPLP